MDITKVRKFSISIFHDNEFSFSEIYKLAVASCQYNLHDEILLDSCFLGRKMETYMLYKFLAEVAI